MQPTIARHPQRDTFHFIYYLFVYLFLESNATLSTFTGYGWGFDGDSCSSSTASLVDGRGEMGWGGVRWGGDGALGVLGEGPAIGPSPLPCPQRWIVLGSGPLASGASDSSDRPPDFPLVLPVTSLSARLILIM